MASPSNAVFTEVLQVEVDVRAFREGLGKLEREYESFVDRLNGKGFGAGNVLNVGGFSSLSKDMAALTENINLLTGHFATSFQTIQQQLGAVTGAIGGATRRTQAAVAAGQNQVNAAAAAARQQLGLTTAAAQQGAQSAQQHLSAWERFYRKLTQNLPELGATIIKYAAGFMLFRAALQGVIDLLLSIPKALTEGIKVLTKYEEVESELQEVIADNVEFSKDFLENWERSGQAARLVRRELEEVAARTHFSAEAIQAVFQSLMTSGGSNFTKDMRELVRLTELFSVALKATGEKVTNQRKLMTEVRNLLTGQVTAKTKILSVMHLTVAEWEKLRKESMTHRDMVARIEPLLTPLIKKLEEAKFRVKEMSAEWELVKERLLATFAHPMFGLFKSFLASVLDFFHKWQEPITAVLQIVSNLVLRVGEFVASLLRALVVLFNVGEGASFLAGRFVDLLDGVTVWLDRLTTGLNIAVKGIEVIRTAIDQPFDTKSWKKAFDDFRDYAVKQGDELDKRTAESALRTAKAKAGRASGGESELKNFLFAPGPKVPNADIDKDLGVMSKKFDTALEGIKEKWSELVETTRTEVEERTRSVQDGTTLVIESYRRQYDEVAALIAAEKARTLALGEQGLAQEKVDARLEVLNRKLIVAERERDKNVEAAKRTLAKDKLAITREQLQQELRLIELYGQAELDERKAAKAAGLIDDETLLRSELAVEARLHSERMALLRDELSQAGENALERLRVLNNIKTEELSFLNEKKRREEELLQLQRTQRDEQIRHALRMQGIGLEKARVSAGNFFATNGGTPRERAQVNLAIAEKQVVLAAREVENAFRRVAQTAANTDERRKAEEDLADAEKNHTAAIGEAIQAQQELSETLPNLANAVLSVTSAITGLVNAFKSGGLGGLMSQLGNFLKGDMVKKMGDIFGNKGALGGFGKALGGMLQKLPSWIGPVLSVGGSLFGFFKSIFTAAARRIGAEIRKNLQTLLQSYQSGDTTLAATIKALEQQRASAISRLSGKKGGKDELNKILPELDKQLADLRLKQKDILNTFQEQLAIMRLQSEPLEQFEKSWRDINKQVKEYLDAGGDVAKANEFLTLSLAKLRDDTARALRDGEEEAIQDAIRLNDLLKERNDLVEEFKRAEFDILNESALERRAAPAVAQGQELARKRKEFQERLTQLDSEIALATKRVDKEREVFNIAQDTAALRVRANELELIALDEQLQKYRDMLSIVRNIVSLPGGGLGYTGSGVNIGTIQVVVNGAGGVNGGQLGGEIAEELTRRFRLGLSPAYA